MGEWQKQVQRCSNSAAANCVVGFYCHTLQCMSAVLNTNVWGVPTKFPEWFYCKPQLTERGHFQVLPFSSPTMSPLFEIFLELLLWNIFQCCRNIFLMSSVPQSLQPFKADFIFGNSHKSFGAKYREPGGCSISVIDFFGQKLLDRERLVSWSLVIVENPIVGPKFKPFFYAQLHVTASLFPHNKFGWLFPLV
jgi:hypothetical protein